MEALKVIESDIEIFKVKFNRTNINFDKTMINIHELSNYKVYNADYYGRCDGVIGYVKALSKSHASLLGSIKYNNPEIFLTGFYGVSKISIEDVNKEIKDATKTIKSLEEQILKLKECLN